MQHLSVSVGGSATVIAHEGGASSAKEILGLHPRHRTRRGREAAAAVSMDGFMKVDTPLKS